MLGSRSIAIDDLFRTDFIGVLIIVEIVVGEIGNRITDAADLAFLTDFDLRNNRMDGECRVVDVRNGARRRRAGL